MIPCLSEPQVRCLQREHLEPVESIERASFPDPYPADEVRQMVRDGAVGYVVTALLPGKVRGCLVEEVVGHALAAFSQGCLDVYSLAVRPDCRRRGAGSLLVGRLRRAALRSKKSRVTLVCRDTNLGAHLFFQRLGFRASRVLRDLYGEGEDGYEFVLRMGPGRQ